MKIGIYKDSAEIYNNEPHLRSSAVKEMKISPGHYLHAKNSPPKESVAFDEGQVTHDVILEQNTDRFIVLPDDAPKKPTKAQLNAKKPSEDSIKAMAWWKDFESQNQGKIVIDKELRESLDQRLNTFVQSKSAMDIYNHSEIETSHYVQDPVTGLHLKARPDILKPGMIADFKTTRSMEYFDRDIWKLGYDIQVGFYSLVLEISTGCEINSFSFIAQEKSAPYGVQVFSLDRDAVAFSKERARDLLYRIAACAETETYPIYSDVVRRVQVPAWVLANHEISQQEEAV